MFFRWSKTHNSNIALFINAFDGTVIESKRQLNEFLQYDIFPRYNEAVAILHEVISSNGFESLSKIVAQYKPFGLRTYIRGTENKQMKQMYWCIRAEDVVSFQDKRFLSA